MANTNYTLIKFQKNIIDWHDVIKLLKKDSASKLKSQFWFVLLKQKFKNVLIGFLCRSLWFRQGPAFGTMSYPDSTVYGS